MPLDFLEDYITWVAPKNSGASGSLESEAIELRNFLLHFICVSEEFRVAVADLSDWMNNSSPLWVAHRSLVACCLVALDKRPGVRPVGIRDTILQAINKIFMRAEGDQVKMACGSLQICAGLEAGIEGATHVVA